MNFKVLLESVMMGVLVIVGLLTVVAAAASIILGLMYLGVPIVPAFIVMGLIVVGIFVGIAHYYENA